MSGKKQHNGFSLRVFNFWMVVAAVIMTALMVYSIYRLSSSFLRMTHATESHIAMGKAATKLMDASDYLTEKAQRFAGTGNMQFLEEYFTEAKESTRREKALDKMNDDPLYDTAYLYLNSAMDASLELMNLEYYGMKLVIEAKGYEYYPEILEEVELSEEDAALNSDEKMRRATELLLSNDYYELKDTIRTNMKRSLKEIERLTRKEEEASKKVLQLETNIVRLIILLQTIGLVAVVWVTSKLGIRPVLKAVERIKEDDPLPEIGASEFRYLAQAYNKMYDVYKRSLENLNFKASHDELTRFLCKKEMEMAEIMRTRAGSPCNDRPHAAPRVVEDRPRCGNVPHNHNWRDERPRESVHIPPRPSNHSPYDAIFDPDSDEFKKLCERYRELVREFEGR